MTRLYIGNLPFDVVERDVEALFATIAPVRALTLIRDRFTGRGRGFGFAEVDAEHHGSVLEALNGTTLKGRPLKVELAKPAPGAHRGESPAAAAGPKTPARNGQRITRRVRRTPREHREHGERALLHLQGSDSAHHQPAGGRTPGPRDTSKR